MKSRLTPTACLDFEPDEAKQLVWLPLAVRYKLDEASLRIRLNAWQALPLEERANLLALPDGPDFRRAALQAGASQHPATPCELPEVGVIAETFGCGLLGATRWLIESSPFSRFVLAKRLAQHCH